MITKLRDQLSKLNLDLFKLLINRKELVKEIQTFKYGNEAFDAERELLLFTDLKSDLMNLDLRELLSFSLMMESHVVSSGKNYPDWLSGEHLAEQSGEVFEMINPVLLYVTKPLLFKRLSLTASFKDILKFSC